jgi:Mn-containing catalase
VFTHVQDLQFEAKPDKPDPAFARRLQEVLGGQWGEMTVATQYLLQGWNCRLPGKYKDMLLDIGTEELAHVEMLVTMIDRLLTAPMKETDSLSEEQAHMNPQHLIVNGGGAYYRDSMGLPWSGGYVTASGNLMADFHYNATAEMQGRLQVARLYNMTDDKGVQNMLRFLLARDRMHQNQWLAAIEELKADGIEDIPVPDAFTEDADMDRAYAFIHASDGPSATEGRWASGPTPDGKGTFTTEAPPRATGERPVLPPGDPRLYSTQSPTEGVKAALSKAKDLLT